MRTKRKWELITANVSRDPDDIADRAAQLRQCYREEAGIPGIEVRTVRRVMRVAGCEFTVHALVARREVAR